MPDVRIWKSPEMAARLGWAKTYIDLYRPWGGLLFVGTGCSLANAVTGRGISQTELKW